MVDKIDAFLDDDDAVDAFLDAPVEEPSSLRVIRDNAGRVLKETLATPLSSADAPVDMAAVKDGMMRIGLKADASGGNMAEFLGGKGIPAPLAAAAGLPGAIAGESIRSVAAAVPTTVGDAALLGLAGPVMEGTAVAAKAIGGPVMRGAGRILADVVGELAGKDPEAVKAIFKNPKAMWKQVNQLFGQKQQAATVSAIEDGLSARGAQFKELEQSFTGFLEIPGAKPVPKVSLTPVLKDITNEMRIRGHRIPADITGKSPLGIGRLPEDGAESKMIMARLKQLKDNPELGFGEALNLRRQLDDTISYGIEGSNGLQPISGEANRVLKLMRRRINSSIRSAVPAEVRPLWDKANFEYSKASEAYAELKKHVIRQSPGETEARLLKFIREGRYDDEVSNRAAKLGEKAAGALDAIRDRISAHQFKRWLGTAGTKPGALGIIPTSPRALGYGAAGAGLVVDSAEALARAVSTNPRLLAALGLAAPDIAAQRGNGGESGPGRRP